MKRYKQNAHNRQYSDNYSPLLAEHAEHQILRGGGDGFQISFSYSYPEQSSADTVYQHTALLIALSVHIVPDMTVGCETLHDEVRTYQNYKSGCHSRRNTDQYQRSEITRTHKGQNKEGEEEYERRSEIPHEEQQRHAYHAENNIFCKAAGSLKLVESCGADKDKRHLYKFRGLN